MKALRQNLFVIHTTPVKVYHIVGGLLGGIWLYSMYVGVMA